MNPYPMPGAAYNVCLTASGDYLEEGDYYIACCPAGTVGVDVAYEDDRGWIAVEETSVTSAYAGRIVDMGKVDGLRFEDLTARIFQNLLGRCQTDGNSAEVRTLIVFIE